MIARVILRFTLLVCLVLVSLVLPVNAAGTLAGTTLELPPVAAPKAAAGQLPDPQVWTTWGASHYALAEDGESLWIGATGGAVRWNRVLRSYRRYTAVDGLPHTAVLAIAVDAAGNRWFGGDAGLSRLDPGEVWTHFTAANSGLYADYVDAIALGGSDTLYLSHGLLGGSVTRRAADGTWRWFPNRETAVQADYALIRQTRGHTRLWTVAGDEVWVGYRTYDGDKWTDHRPSGVTAEPVETAADSRHHFWALATGSTVYEWDGSGWSKHDVPISGSTGKATALAVAADDTVWIGLQQRGGISPYGTEMAGISQLVGGDSWPLDESGPVAALLPTSAGLWAIGPDWLMLPDRSVIAMTDEPRFKDLPDILVEPGGKVWLHSSYSEPYLISALQTFDDHGTAALHDDRWQLPRYAFNGIVLTAWEHSAWGDIWFAGRYDPILVPSYPIPTVRYHGGDWIEYQDYVSNLIYYDIFAQDDRHTWFAAKHAWFATQGHVKGLDDGGTPADTGDDVWQDLPLPAAGEHPVVAVDAGGRLWYGDSNGLYRYDGSSWLSIYTDRGICDLTPAADGTLYAQVPGFGSSVCQPFSGQVLAVRSDGTRDGPRPIEWLVEREPESARSAARRNTLWAVAPDGAIWTVDGAELHRRDDGGLRKFVLPVALGAVQRLEVDVHNHVWLVANSQIWRMSGPLDFALQVKPNTWLLAPGRVRQGQVRILSSEGYSGTVSLSAIEAPADITVRFGADSVAAGQSVTLTLEVAASSLPAVDRLVVSGTDGVLTHTAELTVTIVSELYEKFLPAVFR